MNDNLDDYINTVIGRGDEGSALLAKLTAPTLKNCKYVDVIKEGMNGIAVLRNLPKDYAVVVYSVGGNPQIKDLKKYTASMVQRLVDVSEIHELIPLAFADVVDANNGDSEDIETIGNELRRISDSYGLAVLNGELAILGDRVQTAANINGTMIALAPKKELNFYPRFILNDGRKAVHAAAFEHEGKPVYINSDGIGTKTEFYERVGLGAELSLEDSLAMKLDDTIKLGAIAKVVSDVVEWKGVTNVNTENRKLFPFSWSCFESQAEELSRDYGIHYLLQEENVGNRIRGYNPNAGVFNVSGSVVSLIDEERLKNPLIPHEGEYLVAIHGHPNPRSNGITDKRKTMIRLFGENYHETDTGKLFLEYLAAPSLILYPHFKHLINSDMITSVYHMSGGAYNGKLARPLAKHGLFVSIDNLFPPDWRELTLAGAAFTSAEAAYAKWPMGNDGFVTTRVPNDVIAYLNEHNLKGRVVGKLEKNPDGKTGVELIAFNGQKVYYSGK